jgi:hypothetical protein
MTTLTNAEIREAADKAIAREADTLAELAAHAERRIQALTPHLTRHTLPTNAREAQALTDAHKVMEDWQQVAYTLTTWSHFTPELRLAKLGTFNIGPLVWAEIAHVLAP